VISKTETGKMKPENKHISLNGQRFIQELISKKLAVQSLPEWEKELYLFLNEWFSDSEFILAQTSGSTGEPKPIELPKQLMIKSAERTIEYFELVKNDRMLLSLPCRFIAGKMMVVRAIVGQMNLIAVDPATDFEFLKDEKFVFGAMVPNQLVKMLEQPSGKENLEHIRNLLIGGSGISAALEKQIAMLQNRTVLTYGMTETASHIAIRELTGSHVSSNFHCLPGISVSIGENNCLQIRLPELAKPLQTNDLAELQSENSFRILGRADSVIISGGIKYLPETIEKKLETYIQRRFVISSVPDGKLGEKLVLVIEGEPFETGQLIKQVKTVLPGYEQPKSIIFINLFPETTSGKVIRKEIPDMILTISGE
jgi:O-succinylbenzoic acid--CoA ligase